MLSFEEYARAGDTPDVVFDDVLKLVKVGGRSFARPNTYEKPCTEDEYKRGNITLEQFVMRALLNNKVPSSMSVILADIRLKTGRYDFYNKEYGIYKKAFENASKMTNLSEHARQFLVERTLFIKDARAKEISETRAVQEAMLSEMTMDQYLEHTRATIERANAEMEDRISTHERITIGRARLQQALRDYEAGEAQREAEYQRKRAEIRAMRLEREERQRKAILLQFIKYRERLIEGVTVKMFERQAAYLAERERFRTAVATPIPELSEEEEEELQENDAVMGPDIIFTVCSNGDDIKDFTMQVIGYNTQVLSPTTGEFLDRCSIAVELERQFVAAEDSDDVQDFRIGIVYNDGKDPGRTRLRWYADCGIVADLTRDRESYFTYEPNDSEAFLVDSVLKSYGERFELLDVGPCTCVDGRIVGADDVFGGESEIGGDLIDKLAIRWKYVEVNLPHVVLIVSRFLHEVMRDYSLDDDTIVERVVKCLRVIDKCIEHEIVLYNVSEESEWDIYEFEEYD